MTTSNTELTAEDSSGCTNATTEAQRRQRQRAKGIARAYKRMDSKRTLSSSKLQAPLSPIKETKPKLTTSTSNRSILSISELIDFDEGSLHDSILGDEQSECSELSEHDYSDPGLYMDGLGEDNEKPRAPYRADSLRNCTSGSGSVVSTCSIPAELLMEDPSLATKWAEKKKTTSSSSSSSLLRQDSWTSVNSSISTSGDSVDTFVLNKTVRLC